MQSLNDLFNVPTQLRPHLHAPQARSIHVTNVLIIESYFEAKKLNSDHIVLESNRLASNHVKEMCNGLEETRALYKYKPQVLSMLCSTSLGLKNCTL